MIMKIITLNNGVTIPWLGLGVFRVEDGERVVRSIRHALDAGCGASIRPGFRAMRPVCQ